MTPQEILNKVVTLTSDRLLQEEFDRLRAIAQAAQILANNENIESLPGGKELIKLLEQQMSLSRSQT